MMKANRVLPALIVSAARAVAIMATADSAAAATKPMICMFLPLCQTAAPTPPPPVVVPHHYRHHVLKKKHK